MTSEQAHGLCGGCVHVRAQRNDRGSVFWRCSLAEVDSRYAKYPPLPVLQCAGYEPSPSSDVR